MATKTIAFIGASTGVGLSALKHTLAAGHHAIALCRTPSKLADLLPASSHPNLRIIQGNAKDAESVAQCLVKPDGSLVDAVISTVGGKFIASRLTLDDPQVCRLAMRALLGAIAQLRRQGAAGRPLIVVCSTTGMSRAGRDVPLLLVPLYHVGLKVPHEDKRIMEDDLVASGEDFAVVRCSLLVDGASETPIRVGIEDPKAGLESAAVGYTISREDAGRWFADNLILKNAGSYRNKLVTITY